MVYGAFALGDVTAVYLENEGMYVEGSVTELISSEAAVIIDGGLRR